MDITKYSAEYVGESCDYWTGVGDMEEFEKTFKGFDIPMSLLSKISKKRHRFLVYPLSVSAVLIHHIMESNDFINERYFQSGTISSNRKLYRVIADSFGVN